jgi:hypothetical protein
LLLLYLAHAALKESLVVMDYLVILETQEIQQ